MLGIHFHLILMMMVMMAMKILLWMLTIYCHRGFIGWLRLHWAEREMATIGKGKAVSSNKGYLLMIFITNILSKHKRTFEWHCVTLDDHFVKSVFQVDDSWWALVLVGLKLMALTRLIMMDSCKRLVVFSFRLILVGWWLGFFRKWVVSLRSESGRGQ